MIDLKEEKWVIGAEIDSHYFQEEDSSMVTMKEHSHQFQEKEKTNTFKNDHIGIDTMHFVEIELLKLIVIRQEVPEETDFPTLLKQEKWNWKKLWKKKMIN